MLTPQADLTRDPLETKEFPSPIERLAMLLVLDAGKRTWRQLVTITLVKPWSVYVDESKHDLREPAVWSACAYVTSFDRAVALEREWQAALGHWGINVFHATDFSARYGEFKNEWTDDQRREFIVRLGIIAREHMTLALGCAVREDFFAQSGMRDLGKGYTDAYAFCFFVLLGMFLQTQVAHKDRKWRISLPTPLSFLLDRGFTGVATDIFKARQGHDPNRILGDITPGGRRDVHIPLQAADLLAYYVTREYIEAIHGKEQWFPALMDVLRQRGPKILMVKAQPKHLREFVKIIREVTGEPA